MKAQKLAVVFAVLAAAFYAVNAPLSKLLMAEVDSTMMAAFLYLGAGLGLGLCTGIGRLMGKNAIQEPLTRKELPYTVAMVVLDIAAPILLMNGIARANSANVSLLNNFEIVATTLIAFAVFREAVSRRLTLAIALVTLASVLLSFARGRAVLPSAQGHCSCWGPAPAGVSRTTAQR